MTKTQFRVRTVLALLLVGRVMEVRAAWKNLTEEQTETLRDRMLKYDGTGIDKRYRDLDTNDMSELRVAAGIQALVSILQANTSDDITNARLSQPLYDRYNMTLKAFKLIIKNIQNGNRRLLERLEEAEEREHA